MIYPKRKIIARAQGNAELATSKLVDSAASMVKSLHSKVSQNSDSIVTSTPAPGNGQLKDESLFPFWRQGNMESIIANLNKTKANDDKAIAIQCAIGFRDMPKNEKKKWIAKFKKHQSQNSISISRIITMSMGRIHQPPVLQQK